MLQAFSRLSQLSLESKTRVLQAVQRPTKDTSRVSPSGRFRIHYDTTGFDTPALITAGLSGQRIPNTYEQYIDSVAYYFEFAWRLEVDTLGFEAPPSDGSQGSGPEYDVYVSGLGSGVFGQTSWDASTPIEDGPRQRYVTYIEIENDFLGYRTSGMDGLRITAAHEFQHAIQVGSYGFWRTVPQMDRWFLELTSVWMEHVAFPAIHDYYYDLPNYFQRFRGGLNQSLPFNTLVFGGYERSVWAHFLTKRFGRDVMRNIWTGIKAAPVLASMARVLPMYGTTLESEFALFSAWNYYTADRADPQRYYSEGSDYPKFTPNVSTSFTGLTASVTSSAYPLSTQFYQIALTSDTITAVIANVNVPGAQDPNAVKSDFQLNLSATNLQPPYQKVAKGLGLAFTTSDIAPWRTLYLLSSTRGNANSAPDPSPNPVRLSQDLKLVLSVQGAGATQAEVFLVNTSLEMVYSGQYPVRQAFGTTYVDVPTAGLLGRISTGIYFVVVRCGDTEFKWKVAIIR
ncbi:MAG: hypothetical protein HW412_607 [Bacteroidetes bacterium]|nr:hypothetical protein [Bacteroidota bacterium]